MHLEEVLRRVGASALDPFTKQNTWIHRRVEAVTFPAKNDPIIRRRVSIDFSIPEGLAPSGPGTAGEDEQKYFYVPLSVLRKWPPVLQLDLRTEADESIPLLTRQQNGVADAALLRAMAERVGGEDLEDGHEILELLSVIAERPGDEARVALEQLLPPEHVAVDPIRQHLRRDPQFLELAGGLVDNTLLWLRVEGATGERKVVKFAYDVAAMLDIDAREPAAFGLVPLEVEVVTPHIGSSGSYHLSVVSPAPLDIVDAQLVIKRRVAPMQNLNEGEVVAASDAATSRLSEGPSEADDRSADLKLYSDALGRQARFYISGPREGYFGELRVSVAVQKRGFLVGSAIAGSLIALLLIGLAIGFHEAGSRPERITPVLLLVPGLLAYLVVRPSDHLLAREFLSGSRSILLLSGLMPVVCAGLVAVGGSAEWVHVSLWVAAVIASVLALLECAAAALPRGQMAMPLSNGTSDASWRAVFKQIDPRG